MKDTILRTGGAAALVAVLLVAWIALVSSEDPSSDLATEAQSSSTTSAVPPVALAAVDGDALDEPGDEVTATTAAVTEQESSFLITNSDVSDFNSGPDFVTTTTIASPRASTTSDTTAPVKGPAPVTISRPSCAAGLGTPTTRTAPFTGLSAAIPSGLPAVVVKVSNNSSASRRSLIGLDEADIVFEERIEARATRFFSVFHSSLPANVGPVRSGRTTDIQIAQNLNNPVFGYSGSNGGVARQLKFAADNNLLVPYINTDRAPFLRDGRYSAPDNLFVDPASLGACGGGGNPTAVFSYGSASSTTAQAASSVSLDARSPYRFDWDGSRWLRSQSGSAHVTRTGARLAPKNVVVLFVPYVPSQIDSASVDAQTIGSGEAWVFRDGTITTGNYRRDKGHEGYTLTDGNGGAVRLAAGQTWVVLAPAGSASWN